MDYDIVYDMSFSNKLYKKKQITWTVVVKL